MTTKSVACVMYRYPLGVSSMVMNSMRLFVEKGYRVDVYTNMRSFSRAPVEFDGEPIRIVTYDDTMLPLALRAYNHALYRCDALASCVARLLPTGARLPFLFPDILRFSNWLNRHLDELSYEYVLAVECRSLLCLAGRPDKSNIVYYNMELLDWNRRSPQYTGKPILKALEHAMVCQTPHVAITSPVRAKLFCEMDSYEMERVSVLPVVPMDAPVAEQSAHFRDVFGIPASTFLVLYAGSFEPWAECLALIRSARAWPAGCALVMHTWNRANVGSAYHQDMVAAARGLPVYFSYEYIAYPDLAGALSSADAGLLFYSGTDANTSELLYSSNKLGEYLRAGVPVVCCALPSLKDFVETQQIGVACDLRELPEAIGRMKARGAEYRANVLRCYKENFNFRVWFEQFYRRVERQREA